MEKSDEESEKMKNGEQTEKGEKGTNKGTVTKKRINKPMIERRRRERINECLQQLYSLITELDKGKAKKNKSKLEKADILEMTVDFIKRNRQCDISIKDKGHKQANKESEKQLYTAGYNKCCQELTEMIDENQNIPDELKIKLTNHLQNCRERSNEAQSSDQESSALRKEVFKQYQTIKPKTVLEDAEKEQGSKLSGEEKSRNEVSSESKNSNGANLVLCNAALPTYILVPATTVCRPVHVLPQQQTTPVTVVNPQQTTSDTNMGQTSYNMLDLNRLNLQQSHFVQSDGTYNPSQFIQNLSNTNSLIVPNSTNCQLPTFYSSSTTPMSAQQSNSAVTVHLPNLQNLFSMQVPTLRTGEGLSSIQHGISTPVSQSTGTMWRPW